MVEDTNDVLRKGKPASRLDTVDRKLLGLLADDGTQSYADLGKKLNLSAPAVHERVKRLKRDGVIKAVIAKIDGVAVGRPLLAFILVDTRSWSVTQQLLALEQFPEVEEIHTVAGEAAMILKIRTRDTQELNHLLAKIHAIEGFEGTRTYVTLASYLERGPSPSST